MTDNTKPRNNVAPLSTPGKPNQGDGGGRRSGGGGDEPPMETVMRIAKIEADLVRLESKLETSFSRQESQFAQLAAKFDIGFAKVDSRFSEVETKIAQTESSFFKWAIGFVIAIIGTTFAIVRFANDRPSQQAPSPQPLTQVVPIVIPMPTQTSAPTPPINPLSPEHGKAPIKQHP